jgi:uncharacterized membrane protein required for colicin V production
MSSHAGINWFDLAAVVFIVVGIVVGRRKGMSSELLNLIQWLAMVIVGALTYKSLGLFLAEASGLDLAVCSVAAYLAVAALIWVAGVLLKRNVGEKLVGSDVFGGFEYYLGMVAGAARFACMLVFVLALMRAHQISDADLKRQIDQQRTTLGSVYFPPFGAIQRYLYRGSFTGRFITENLDYALIEVDPKASRSNRDSVWKRRERDVNDVIDYRK